jgi:hypothetical protein
MGTPLGAVEPPLVSALASAFDVLAESPPPSLPEPPSEGPSDIVAPQPRPNATLNATPR